MTTLLELKEKLTRFYGKYDIYITPVIKFTVALTAFLVIWEKSAVHQLP